MDNAWIQPTHNDVANIFSRFCVGRQTDRKCNDIKVSTVFVAFDQVVLNET